MTLKAISTTTAVICLFTLSSFITKPSDVERPRTISTKSKLVDGTQFKTTIVTFDKHTTREDVIQTCVYLSQQKIQLTFNSLEIGKSFFGVVGKTRLKFVDGKIVLPNGHEESFKAGGALPFKTVRMQFTQQRDFDPSQIDMIEIVD